MGDDGDVPLAAIAKPPTALPEHMHWDLRATQGQPACGVEVRIVDADGTVLPRDGVAVGELQVRGPWVTGAYYRQESDGCFRDGWLVTPEDPDVLSDAIDTLLGNAELRAQLGVAAGKRMEQFDRHRILPQFGSLFAEVARKRLRVPVRDGAEDYGFTERPVTLGAGK